MVCLEQFFIQGLQPATAAIVGFVGMLATFPTTWCAPYHSRGKLFTKISIYTIYIYISSYMFLLEYMPCLKDLCIFQERRVAVVIVVVAAAVVGVVPLPL